MGIIQPKPSVELNFNAPIINTKLGGTNSVCSCHECDTSMCFARRYRNSNCSCSKCGNSKTCLFYSNDIANIKRLDEHSNNSKMLQVSKSSLNEVIDNKDIKNESTHKIEIIIEGEDKIFVEQSKYDCDNKVNISKVTSTPQRSKVNYDITKVDEINDIPLIDSLAVASERLNSPTAKLSAKIMDLPYQDFKASLSVKRSEIGSNKFNNISVYDIYKRIKEVYDACSCKACECLGGKLTSIKNELCKCKPCVWDDCITNALNQNVSAKGTSDPDPGCPHVRCTNSKCKGIVKMNGGNMNKKKCDCKPCECVKYIESFTKPCDCKPCQCIECKSVSLPKYKTATVAAVGKLDNQRNACQCQPCECVQCGNDHRELSNFRHEISTGLNRHQHCCCEACVEESCTPDANDTCKCERRSSFMRKPVQRGTYDFDVRHAIAPNELAVKVKEDSKPYGTMYSYMFAALTNNNNPKFASKKKSCDCNECQCLLCNSQYHTDHVQFNNNITNRNVKACKGFPCECQYCNRILKQETGQLNFVGSTSKICDCIGCTCLNCDGLNQPSIKQTYIPKTYVKIAPRDTSICKCQSCECRDCQMDKCIENEHHLKPKYVREKSSDDLYPMRGGKSMEPTMVGKTNNRKHREITDSDAKISSSSVQTYYPKQDQRLNIAAYPYNIKHASKVDTLILGKSPLNKKRKSEDFINRNYKSMNQLNTNLLYKNQYVNDKAKKSGKDISALLRKPTYEESVGILPGLLKKYNLKSVESACSTSTKDSSTCLLRYTKIDERTLQKYINDVMKLNLNPEVSLDRNSMTGLVTSSGIKYNSCEDDVVKQSYDTNVVGHNFPLETVNIKGKENYMVHNTTNLGILNGTGNVEPSSGIKRAEVISLETLEIPKRTKLNKNDTEMNVNTRSRNNSKVNVKNFNQKLTNTEIIDIVKYNENVKNRSILLNSENFDRFVNSKTTSVNNKDVSKVLDTNIYYSKSESDVDHFNNLNQELKNTEKIDTMENSVNNYNSEEFKNKNTKPKSIVIGQLFSDIKINTLKDTYTISPDYSSIEENKYNLENKSNAELSTESINAIKESINFSKTINESFESTKFLGGDELQNFAKNDTNYFVDVNHKEDICGTCMFSEKETNQINDVDIKTSYKKYRKMIKRASFIAKRFNAGRSHILKVCTATETSNTSITKGNEKSVTNHNNKGIDSKIVEQPEEKNTHRMLEVYEKKNNNINTSHISMQHQEEKEPDGTGPWKIYKKNFDLCEEVITRNINGFCRREENTKKSIHHINLQKTINTDGIKDYGYENNALSKAEFKIVDKLDESTTDQVKELKFAVDGGVLKNKSESTTDLQRRIKELLELSIVYPVVKDRMRQFGVNQSMSTDLQKFSTTSVKSSCESQKVSFLGLRRVSDHTVLVKWNTPRVMANVQGYELLVDGCAVQKLINPTKCMAVVTCLPHSDKVLLTIKTIVSTVNWDHFPSTSIVYRPRL